MEWCTEKDPDEEHRLQVAVFGIIMLEAWYVLLVWSKRRDNELMASTSRQPNHCGRLQDESHLERELVRHTGGMQSDEQSRVRLPRWTL